MSRTMYQVECQDEETGSWKSVKQFSQEDANPNLSFFARLFTDWNFQPSPVELRKQARVAALKFMLGSQSCRISEYVEVCTDSFHWHFESVVWKDGKWFI